MDRSLLVCLSLVLAACTDKEEEETGAPPLDTRPQDSDTGDSCPGGTPPVIESLTTANAGITECEAGQAYPQLDVTVDVTDADYDLESYHYNVWYDDAVDGSVEQGDNGLEVLGTLSSDGPCTASGGAITMQICLLGGGVEYDTLYEWGAIVTDSNGFASEMAFTSGCTPTAEGEDGCE